MRRGRFGWVALAVAMGIGIACLAGEVVEIVDSTGATVRVRPAGRAGRERIRDWDLLRVRARGGGSACRAWYVGVKGIDQAPPALLHLEPRLQESPLVR